MKKPEIFKLEGELREAGPKTADKLREDLRIPAVLYGPKVKENVHFPSLKPISKKYFPRARPSCRNSRLMEPPTTLCSKMWSLIRLPIGLFTQTSMYWNQKYA